MNYGKSSYFLSLRVPCKVGCTTQDLKVLSTFLRESFLQLEKSQIEKNEKNNNIGNAVSEPEEAEVPTLPTKMTMESILNE
jgi:hypothetical protein